MHGCVVLFYFTLLVLAVSALPTNEPASQAMTLAVLPVTPAISEPAQSVTAPAPAPATQAPASIPLPEVSTGVEKGKSKILIGVVSSPAHVHGRNAIRNTWGRDAIANGFDVKFFIGQLPQKVAITNEQITAEGSDIVRLSDFTESYHNLTAKAIGIFEYGYKNGYKGVFKSDDDTYLRVPKLMNLLSNQFDLEHLYSGHIFRGMKVSQKQNTRWYAFDQYPQDEYPPYANGPGLFLGRSGLKHIAQHKDSLNRIRVDDAALGVWMRDAGGMNIVQMDTSTFEYTPSKDAVWVGPINAEEMNRMYAGESFAPSVCFDAEYGCLCHNHPKYTDKESGECWYRFATSSYTDYIPRHTS